MLDLPRVTQAVEAFLDAEAEATDTETGEIVREAVTTAQRLCLERIAPPCREAPVTVDLPAIARTGELPKAIAVLLQATARGDLTPGEAGRLAALVGEAGKALKPHDRGAIAEAGGTTDSVAEQNPSEWL